MYTNDHVAEK